MDRLQAMRVFCGVVEAEGFSAAGHRLGIAHSTASRQVKRLEQALGAQLLQGATTKVQPRPALRSDSGATLFEAVRAGRGMAVLTWHTVRAFVDSMALHYRERR